MKSAMSSKTVYNEIMQAIDEIAVVANQFTWEDEAAYATWLSQSFMYVQWTTRQLALASAMTKPMTEDVFHWRFIEEAREEKKHELLVLHDLKNLGYSIEQFPELPHTSFFYQTLTYMIQHDHPISILGYSLTLEGFAAKRVHDFFPRVKAKYEAKTTTFIKTHCELDADHFDKGLAALEECPAHLIPIILKGIAQCKAIYIGILNESMAYAKTKKPIKNKLNSTYEEMALEPSVTA